MTNELDIDNYYIYREDLNECIEDERVDLQQMLEAYFLDYDIPLEVGITNHIYRGEEVKVISHLFTMPLSPSRYDLTKYIFPFGQKIIDIVQKHNRDYTHYLIGQRKSKTYIQLIRDKSIIEVNMQKKGKVINAILSARQGIGTTFVQPIKAKFLRLNYGPVTDSELEEHVLLMLDVLETWHNNKQDPSEYVHYKQQQTWSGRYHELNIKDRNRLENENTYFFL
tara:strand:- start:516 stop:1187 length:672 start_codon:yes stop_codon:yes gene_type:complete